MTNKQKHILIIVACLLILGAGVFAGRYYAAQDTGYPVRVLNFNDLESVNLNWQGTEPQDVFGGTVLFPYQGGTGIASYSAGEMLYASGPGTLSRLLASGSEGQVIKMTSGIPAWGADVTGAGTPDAHGLLSDWGHNDVSNASASAGALIYGSGTTWTPLAVGASGSFLLSDGTNPLWNDIGTLSVSRASISDDLTIGSLANCDTIDADASGTLSCGTDSSGTGAAILHSLMDSDWHGDTLLASVSAGSLILGNATPKWSELTIGASQSFLMSDGTTAFWADYVDQNTTYTGGDNLTLTGTDFDVDDPFTVVGLNGTHVSASEDFTTPSGQITSLSASTLNFPNDSVTEEDIDFNTACAAGNHYYLNGNDLACEADANTTYTGGDHLTLTGTDFDVDDDFLLNNGDTGTWISLSADFQALQANIASVSGTTLWGFSLADCDADNQTLAWSDTGVFGCGDDDNTTYTGGDNLTLTGTDFDVDDPFTVVTFTATHASISDDLESNKGQFASLSATTLNFPNDSVAEADIDFDTACAAGSHYYLNGNDLACETDDNTTYTAGDNLTLTGTDFDVDDPFTIVTFLTTHASISDDLNVADAETTSLSAGTFAGAGLADCDTAATSKLLWSDTGVFSCGIDQAGGVGGEVHGLLNTDWHTDVLLASVSQGSLIVGNATPKWSELTIGASGSFLMSDTDDAVWDDIGTLIAWNASISEELTIGAGVGNAGFLSVRGDFSVNDGTSAIADSTFYIDTAGGNFYTPALSGIPCDTIDIDADGLWTCGTDANTTYTATEPLWLNGTAFDIELASTGGDGYLSKADWDTFNGKWDGLTDMVLTDTYIYVGNGSNDPVGVAMSNDCTISNLGAITCDHDALANFVANEHIDWTAASSSIHINGNIEVDGTASISGAFTLGTDVIQESAIDFNTACAAGSHFYLNGNDLACETDDDTTYTAGDNLTLTGTDFDVDDPFSVTGLTGTHVSASGDFSTPSGQITSLSASTILGAGLVDCDNATTSKLLYSDTGVFSCGTDTTGAGAADTHGLLNSEIHTDTLLASASIGSLITAETDGWKELTIGASQSFLMSNGTSASWYDYADLNTTYTATDPLFLTGTAFDIDYASAGGGGYILGTTWEDFNGKLSSLSIDLSSELITIIGDETGSGVIVFGTSPVFTTSFTTTGVFAINPGGALTIGDGGDTTAMNSSDWDISVTGDMTGIGGITMNGALLASGSAQFTTGTVEFDGIVSTSNNWTAYAGAWDLGALGSFELPNAAAPTVDAIGEIAIDTTEDQLIYYGTFGKEVIVATKSIAFGVASGSATLLVDGPSLPFDFTITSSSCRSGNVAGEIYIIDVYECSNAGVCGEHINTASVSCDMNATSFARNDTVGTKAEYYRFKIQSTNDSCENTDQVILNLWGTPTAK